MNIWIVLLIVLFLNLPFGYWRANVGRMTPQWFLAVHVPVALAIALRITAGLGWDLVTFPALVVAFSSGQFLGAKLHQWWRSRVRASFSSCLIWDMLEELRATARSS